MRNLAFRKVVCVVGCAAAFSCFGAREIEFSIDPATANVKAGCQAQVTVLKGAVDVSYGVWDSTDLTKWPGFQITLPKDCSDYDDLVATVENVTGEMQDFSVKFTDLKGKGMAISSGANPMNAVDCVFPLYHPDRYDVHEMGSASFYYRCPRKPGVFRISNIRLVNRLPERALCLAEDFRTLGEKARAREIESLLARVKAGSESVEKARAALDALERLRSTTVYKHWRKVSAKNYPKADFAVGWLDGMSRVRPVNDSMAGVPIHTKPVMLELARNEREGVQILALAPESLPIRDLCIEAGTFMDESGYVLARPVCAPVGRVTITRTRGLESAKGPHFDPICEFTDRVGTVSNGWIQAFHVRFAATAKTRPGLYRGTIRLFSGNAGRAEVPVAVRVHAVTLPTTPTLKTATALYGAPTGTPFARSFGHYVLGEYHLNPFSIYSDASYGMPRLPSIAEYLEAKKLGLNFIPILYLKLPRQALHSDMGGSECGYSNKGRALTPNESKGAWAELPPDAPERKYYDAAHKKMYLEILRKRVPELKAAGLWDIASCYGFDEANFTEWPAMKDLTDALRAEFPDLKIISTLYDSFIGIGDDNPTAKIINGWIPYEDKYNLTLATKARKFGREAWYYTTKMTIDEEPLPFIRAELGLRAVRARVDGWLVWTVSRWCDNTRIVSAEDTGWNPESFPGDNGGGSYFCRGTGNRILPTLRAEAIRDGIEDHMLFTLVLNSKSPAAQALAKRLSPSDQREYSAKEIRDLRRQALRVMSDPAF